MKKFLTALFFLFVLYETNPSHAQTQISEISVVKPYMDLFDDLIADVDVSIDINSEICGERFANVNIFLKPWNELSDHITCHEILVRTLALVEKIAQQETVRQRFLRLLQQDTYRKYVPISSLFVTTLSRECGIKEGRQDIEELIVTQLSLYFMLLNDAVTKELSSLDKLILYSIFLTEMGAYIMMNTGKTREEVYFNECFNEFMSPRFSK